MPPTQDAILSYLHIHAAASAVDLSLALNLTVQNIRHHLAILQSQGKVVAAGRRAPKARGRPTALYSLSAQIRSNNLSLLSGALLDELSANLPPQEAAGFLHRVATRIAGLQTAPPKNMTLRLSQAVQRLKELNYQARWEARADSPRVLLGYCPYAAILPEHPELCRMDAFLLEELLQCPVKQIARMDFSSPAKPYCIFAL